MQGRAELDRLYNLRQAVPSHAENFARWRAWSAAARAALPHRADLTYGDHPRETLNFFAAPEPGRPILVFIHGGFWQAMDKTDFDFVAQGFASAQAGGIANVALLNYPLAPAARMDRIVASLRRALFWLWRQAPALGADPDAIFVAGHSAGGHLAAMAALADWPAQDPKAPTLLVKGAFAISGIFDLRPVQLCFHNDILRMDLDEAERNSPLLLLSSANRGLAPMAFAVGEDETEAFHDQQSSFVSAYHGLAPVVMAITEPRRHHFDILDTLGSPGVSDLRAGLVAMLRGAHTE